MSETESKIDQLESENEELRDRLDKLEDAIETAAEEVEVVEVETDDEADGDLEITRRGTLATLAGAGILGLGATGSAAAQQTDSNFGDSLSGSGSFGLEVDNNETGDDFTFGVIGRAESPRARGIAGFADNSSGESAALFGRNQSSDGKAIRGFADATSGQTRGIQGTCKSPDGYGIEAINSASSGNTVAMRVDTSSPDGVGLLSDSDAQINGDLSASGNLDVSGNINTSGGDLNVSGTKHFVQAVETPSGEKTVRYTSVEAGRARTEVTDIAEMEDGRAEIELPEHFDMVTSDEEPLSVQVTPYAAKEVKPQVVDQSTEQVIVEDFSDDSANYTFAYTVKGIREGFEDKDVVLEDE